MNEYGTAVRKKVKRTQEQINQMCEEWRRSGLTKTTFCQRKGLCLSLFCRWLKNQGSDSTKKMNFLPLTKISSTESAMKLEIELPQGMILRFSNIPETAVIRDLMVGLQHVTRHSQ